MATGWDPDQLTIVDPADHTNPILYDPATGEPRATVLTISPDAGWISDAVLKGQMQALKAARQEGDPMRLDGLYYTNNAIFGIVARSDRMRGSSSSTAPSCARTSACSRRATSRRAARTTCRARRTRSAAAQLRRAHEGDAQRVEPEPGDDPAVAVETDGCAVEVHPRATSISIELLPPSRR
jgi:hypothetical protein